MNNKENEYDIRNLLCPRRDKYLIGACGEVSENSMTFLILLLFIIMITP